MNNLSSCCGLVDPIIRASHKDLPVRTDAYQGISLILTSLIAKLYIKSANLHENHQTS